MRGHTNNPKGRPRGVPNKITANLREWITNFLMGNLRQFKKDWKILEPKDRMVLFVKLLRHVAPVESSYIPEFEKWKMERDELESMTDEELEAKVRDLYKKLEL